jgi:hypothetical protein
MGCSDRWQGVDDAYHAERETGEKQANLARYEAALRLVLLFYRSGPWTAEDAKVWRGFLHASRGKDNHRPVATDVTTKAMCDAIREVLGEQAGGR